MVPNLDPEVERVLLLLNPTALVPNDMPETVIGVVYLDGRWVACCSADRCVKNLLSRGVETEEEAIEYLEFNTFGAYVGEDTPRFVWVEHSPGSSE